MKFLRSFDTYLLERYPILWHSKVIYLVATGIVFWLLFFVTGYLMVDLETLKDSAITRLYEHSYTVAVHVILVIVALSLWALYLFKKNAIHHYYPLKPFYFTRMFLCLIIGVLPLISAFLPFEYGTRLKTRSLITVEQLQEDAKKVNLALTFLPTAESNYGISNRCYPSPFPLDRAYYNGVWEYGDLDYRAGAYYYEDSLSKLRSYEAGNHPENDVTVEGTAYQFFRAKFVPTKSNCQDYDGNGYQLISSFHRPDSSLDLRKYSILNYSSIEYPASYMSEKQPLYYYERGYDEIDHGTQLEFKKDYAPTIHRWVKNDQKDSVAWSIREFKKVLDSYGIHHVIDEQRIARHLSKGKYAIFNTSFVDTYLDPNDEERLKAKLPYLTDKLEGDFVKTTMMGYDDSSLSNVYENARTAYFFSMNNPDEVIALIFGLALGISLLLLLFDFTNFIQFLIAIPSAGVLAIIIGVCSALIGFAARSYDNRDLYAGGFAFGISSIILLICISGTLSRFFNKRFAGVLLNIGYCIAPLYLCFVVVLMDQFTRYQVYDECYNGMINKHTFWQDILLSPVIMLSLSFIGSISYFALIKRWYAKEE